jgi:hypothetical protein
LFASLFTNRGDPRSPACLRVSNATLQSDSLRPDAHGATTAHSVWTAGASASTDATPIWILGVGPRRLRPARGRPASASPAQYADFQFGIGVAAVLAGAALANERWLGRVAFPLLLATHVLLAVWVLRASPNPHIDVSYFHRDAFAALLRGENPHEGTIPNIYPDTAFYGDGIVENGRVLVGSVSAAVAVRHHGSRATIDMCW